MRGTPYTKTMALLTEGVRPQSTIAIEKRWEKLARETGNPSAVIKIGPGRSLARLNTGTINQSDKNGGDKKPPLKRGVHYNYV